MKKIINNYFQSHKINEIKKIVSFFINIKFELFHSFNIKKR